MHADGYIRVRSQLFLSVCANTIAPCTLASTFLSRTSRFSLPLARKPSSFFTCAQWRIAPPVSRRVQSRNEGPGGDALGSLGARTGLRTFAPLSRQVGHRRADARRARARRPGSRVPHPAPSQAPPTPAPIRVPATPHATRAPNPQRCGDHSRPSIHPCTRRVRAPTLRPSTPAAIAFPYFVLSISRFQTRSSHTRR